jgi:hypothetical protein
MLTHSAAPPPSSCGRRTTSLVSSATTIGMTVIASPHNKKMCVCVRYISALLMEILALSSNVGNHQTTTSI